jgi:hypothetical protein
MQMRFDQPVAPRFVEDVRAKLQAIEAEAEQYAHHGARPPAVRVLVDGRAAVLAWPGEPIVVWADDRTPYRPPSRTGDAA